MSAIALGSNNQALTINAQNAQSTKYLGPTLSNDFERLSPHKFSENIVPAYVPSKFLWTSSSFDDEKLKKKIKTAKVEELLNKPEVNLQLLKKIEKDIKNHFETRILLFLQQALLVYKTNIVFQFCNKAIDQIGSTDSSHSIKKIEKEGSYAAAHSSTLPCLRVKNTASKVESVVFARGSYFFDSWNATVFVPTQVNVVDKDFDTSKTKCKNKLSFRERCTVILNKVSSGKKTPDLALDDFLKIADEYIHKLIKSEKDKEKKYILQTYLSVVNLYREKFDEQFVKNFCLYAKSPLEGDDLYISIHTAMFDSMLKELASKNPQESQDNGFSDFRVSKLVYEYFQKKPVSCAQQKPQSYAKHLTKVKKIQTLAMQLLESFNQQLKKSPKSSPDCSDESFLSACNEEICDTFNLKNGPAKLKKIAKLVFERIATEKAPDAVNKKNEFLTFKTPPRVLEYFQKNKTDCSSEKAQKYAKQLTQTEKIQKYVMKSFRSFNRQLKKQESSSFDFANADFLSSCKEELKEKNKLKDSPRNLKTIIKLVYEKIALEKS